MPFYRESPFVSLIGYIIGVISIRQSITLFSEESVSALVSLFLGVGLILMVASGANRNPGYLFVSCAAFIRSYSLFMENEFFLLAGFLLFGVATLVRFLIKFEHSHSFRKGLSVLFFDLGISSQPDILKEENN